LSQPSDTQPRLYADLRHAVTTVVQAVRPLTERELAPSARRLLLSAIVAWYLAQTLTLVPWWDSFWALDGFAATEPFSDVGVGDFVNHPAVRQYWPVAIAIFSVFGFVTLARPNSAIWPLCFYLAARNVESLCPQIADGGSNLMRLLLLYLAVGNVLAAPEQLGVPVGACARNLTLVACRLQIALVYLCAGLYKVTGHLWTNGMALYYIGQSDYAVDSVLNDMLAVPLLSFVACYSVVAFQVSFPFLVFSRVRKLVLGFGVLFHVLIIVTLGLTCFGLAMMISYLAFAREQETRLLDRSIHARDTVQLELRSTRAAPVLRWLARRAPKVSFAPAASPGVAPGDALLLLLGRSYPTRVLAPLWATFAYLGVLDLIGRRLGLSLPEAHRSSE
jgi:hypothetical protein